MRMMILCSQTQSYHVSSHSGGSATYRCKDGVKKFFGMHVCNSLMQENEVATEKSGRFDSSHSFLKIYAFINKYLVLSLFGILSLPRKDRGEKTGLRVPRMNYPLISPNHLLVDPVRNLKKFALF